MGRVVDQGETAAFAIKVEVVAKASGTQVFHAQKTMYGGRRIARGDVLFIFDSETEGGAGLWARGRVRSAVAAPKRPDVARQTPRVDVVATELTFAVRPLGRADLKPFKAWDDGRPETELNFKFYRQATNKLVGLSPAAATFLAGFFVPR